MKNQTETETKQYRQGDVFVTAIDSIPSDVKEVQRDAGRIVLAYGEVTGHAHAITSKEATLWERGDVRYLEVKRACTLSHEEHSQIALPAGTYQVIRQREYHPEAVRQVAD